MTTQDLTLTAPSSTNLQQLADQYLGDFRYWRELATVNQLGDFLSNPSLESLQNIQIPNREQLEEITNQLNTQVSNLRAKVSQLDYSNLDLSQLGQISNGSLPWQLVDWVF
jgi:hypothetical protein